MNCVSTSAHEADTKSLFNERLIRAYSLFVSLFFLISVPIAVIYKTYDDPFADP